MPGGSEYSKLRAAGAWLVPVRSFFHNFVLKCGHVLKGIPTVAPCVQTLHCQSSKCSKSCAPC